MDQSPGLDVQLVFLMWILQVDRGWLVTRSVGGEERRVIRLYYYSQSERGSGSVMSDSLWPHGLEPARLLCPWDSPARILEWTIIPFFRGSSQPQNWTWVSYIAGGFFTVWASREALLLQRRLQRWWSIALLVDFTAEREESHIYKEPYACEKRPGDHTIVCCLL